MTYSAVICHLKKQRLVILQAHCQTSNANTSIASLIERLVHNQLHWNRVGTVHPKNLPGGLHSYRVRHRTATRAP